MKTRTQIAIAIIVPLMLPVTYFLSWHPAETLAARGYLPVDILDSYEPLYYAERKSPTFKAVTDEVHYRWYQILWYWPPNLKG